MVYWLLLWFGLGYACVGWVYSLCGLGDGVLLIYYLGLVCFGVLLCFDWYVIWIGWYFRFSLCFAFVGFCGIVGLGVMIF